jgi:hypothetical protein
MTYSFVLYAYPSIPVHQQVSKHFQLYGLLSANPHHESGCFLLEFLIVFCLKEVHQQSPHSSSVSDSTVG